MSDDPKAEPTSPRRTPRASREVRFVALGIVALCDLEGYRLVSYVHPWRVVLCVALAAIALSTLPLALRPNGKDSPWIARMLPLLIVDMLDEMGRANAVNRLEWIVPGAAAFIMAKTFFVVRRGEREGNDSSG